MKWTLDVAKTDLQLEAEAEFAQELRRQQIDAIKDTLRERRMRPWWVRLFPFRIHITRL